MENIKNGKTELGNILLCLVVCLIQNDKTGQHYMSRLVKRSTNHIHQLDLLLLQGNRYGHCSTCCYYKGIGMVIVPLVIITRE